MVDVIENIKEKVEEGLEKAGELIEEGKEKVEDLIEEGAEKVGAIAENIVEKMKDKKESKSKKTKEVAEESKDEEEMKKKAEEESTTKEKSIQDKKKELLEKVAKLKEKVSGADISSEELKEQIKIKKRTDMLIPLEEYVKAGIYLGTRVVTPDMKPFVYRRRADGLAIFNTDLIDEKLKEAIEYLSGFDADKVILVCKRQAGWKAAKKFGELTGIRVFAKKYPAGILTNTSLPDFFENELTIVTDSWLDKNSLSDTMKVNKKVLMICDTNNFSKGASKIIIGNNKSAKSLGVIFYLLAKGYCKAKGIEADIPELEWWTEEEKEKKSRGKSSKLSRGVKVVA